MSFEKMVEDQDTAYDEVLDDLLALTDKYVKEKSAKEIFNKKLQQLRRIIDGGEEET
jgi:hypothetical protein